MGDFEHQRCRNTSHFFSFRLKYAEISEDKGVDVEIISVEIGEEQQLLKDFGEIAAISRYAKVSSS